MGLFNFNFNFIKGNNNKVAQDGSKIEPSEKLLESLNSRLDELQKNSPYPIHAIEVNDNSYKYQEDLIKRDSVVSEICYLLDKHKCVILTGDILIGKTSLAELVGLSKRGLNPIILKIQYKTDLNPMSLIPQIAEDKKYHLLIIDGFPEYDIEYLESLCQIISNATQKELQIIITTRHFNKLIANRYGFEQYGVPVISADELQSSIPQCSEALAKIIINTSGGYPMLVNLLLFYLRTNNWKLKEQQIIDFISIPKKEKVHEYVNKKIHEIITDTQDLQLLSRLSLFWHPFTKDDVVSVAGANPVLVTPNDRISRLSTQGIISHMDGRMNVSPFVKKVWAIDLLEQEQKECVNIIIGRIINKRTIDIYDADNIILLLCNSKEYERAGWFYVSCMTKLLELKIQDASQVSFLTMLWHELPLPSEMSVFTRTFIRILQIQMAHLTKEDCTYATNDLVALIGDLPTSNPLKAIASCFAISELSFSGDMHKALPLLQYARPAITRDLNDEYLTVIKEQQEITEKLPVLMLAGISNLGDLMQWFDNVGQSSISTNCIDTDAVKFVLNKVVVVGNEEAALRTIIDRTQGSDIYKVFLAVAVARLMLFLFDQKRYSDAWRIYEANRDLTQTKLGSILINNALACYYHDIQNVEEALKCWEITCSENALAICPDEVIFSRATMASIYSEQKDISSAVNCLESVINDSSFSVSLIEYQQMQMRGELAISYWDNGQKHESFKQLMIIHNYLYVHRFDIDDNYKLLELKYGICVQQYHYFLENGTFEDKFVMPKSTMFQRPNKQFIEAYSNVRTGTNIMYLFMMAASLKEDKETALMLAHHTIECYAKLIDEKSIACGLLNELVPLLLEYSDYDNALYIIKSSIGLATSIKDAPSPVHLLSYLPLLPISLKMVIDCSSGNSSRIESIISSHILDSLLVFPEDGNLQSLRDVIINNNDSRYSDITEDNVRISARLYRFRQLNILSSINVIIIASMFCQVHKYYGFGLLKSYVYRHAKYIINKFESNYRNKYKKPLEELEKVRRFTIDDMEATKKMIRLLIAYSKVEVPLSNEQENFIGI